MRTLRFAIALPYAIALVAVAVALAVRALAAPWLESRLPSGPLYAVVALAAWYGGWRPGLLAAVTGFLVTEAFFGGLSAEMPLSLLLYGASCGAIIYFLEAYRRALADATRLTEALRAQMREQHEAAARLRAAEARFRESHDASLQGYAMLSPVRDPDGLVGDFVVEYINPAGAVLAGTDANSIIGRRLSELRSESPALLQRLVRVMASGQADDFELEYTKGGSRGRFRHLAARSGDGIAVAFVDVTPAQGQPSAEARSAVTRLR